MRGWDTLGELTVVVAAATGVASLIFVNSREDTLPRLPRPAPSPRDERRDGEPRAWLPTSAALPTGRSALLEVVVRLLFHGLIVLSRVPAVRRAQRRGRRVRGRARRGHRARGPLPGRGPRRTRCRRAVARAGSAPGARGRDGRGHGDRPAVLRRGALYSEFFEATVPVLGHVEFVTAMFFDIGVYLVVVGLVLDVLRSLGAEVDRQRLEDSRTSTRDTIEADRDPEEVSA